jgi:hypothetical protein
MNSRERGKTWISGSVVATSSLLRQPARRIVHAAHPTHIRGRIRWAAWGSRCCPGVGASLPGWGGGAAAPRRCTREDMRAAGDARGRLIDSLFPLCWAP